MWGGENKGFREGAVLPGGTLCAIVGAGGLFGDSEGRIVGAAVMNKSQS